MSWNLRMPSFQAAMLVPQVRRCPSLFARRCRNMDYLRKQLKDFPGIELQTVPGQNSVSAYHLILGRLIPERFKGLSKSQFLRAIAAEGIPFSGGYEPLYRAEMFQRDESGRSPVERHTGLEIDPLAADCPVCERVSAEEAFWGTQRLLLGDEKDMDDIVRAIHKVYENADEAREGD
jgi:dTDP-4-amino-4,6-dideoxygalactose transaminase